ncbi:polynucleotide 5'-hydroxyl-kinase NOL9 [Nylanderia fulva]|uniref:polynucleotide 5'-hydroxyl-kinase NOL9 n=1 Tax=Nylanderia fulva TaxID=613905 RepID=UPI0010FB88C6|nr:polynucleotide 5'-hydroxyl-kinase NOL9 [Nylanderia fulva]
MKVKHNSKGAKKKKAKLKKNARKLTTRKIEKHSVGKNKSMLAYKQTTVNFNNMDINAQNIPSNSTVDSIRWDSSEELTNKEMDNDWKLDNSDEEIEAETDDWTQIAPKEKRNIELPVVMEMHSNDVSSNLSQIFKQKTCLNKELYSNKEFYSNIFQTDIPSNDEACVIVAKSINPKHDTYVQTQTSSVPPNTDKNNKNKHTSENKLKNSINNISSPKRNPKCRNVKSKKSIDCNTETVHRSSHLQNRVQSSRNKKTPAFYCIRNIVIVIMKSESRLCFTGKLLVKVLYGAVQIYGYILNKSTSTTEVYSPRGYSNIAIETSKEYPVDNNIEDIWAALAVEDITRDSESQLQADIDKVQPGEAVLVLQNFDSNLTLFLKTYFSYLRLFPDVNNSCYYPWTDPRRAEIILQAELHFEQSNSSTCKRLISDPVIIDIAQRMLSRWRKNEWSCTLIAGGKNVGKSTSVRYLINTLLQECSRVILIDVDPGQAECTPPSCISYSLIEEPLMGPSFTHLKIPVYQLFIDDVNVARCVTRYLEGIKMLIERLKGDPELSRLPVVVNTMGFAKNLGWDIAIFTIKLIRPSIIVQIMSSKRKNNYDNVFSAEVVNKQECSWTFCDEKFINWDRSCEHDLCIINSPAEVQTVVDQGPNQWNMEPYQQRELMMMSYLSDIVRNNDDSFHYNAGLSRSINQAIPYTAPFSSLCIIPQRLFGIPESHALSIVNGNIVALCGIDLTEESSQESTNISTLRILTQRSPLCTCYGFGIVRGVDMEQQQVFINTPLPISMMQHVNCLAGCIPVPPMLLQLHPGVPYVSGNAMLPTSREPRKGYFRMRYRKNRSHSKS